LPTNSSYLTTINQRFARFVFSGPFAVFLILLGSALRLKHYFENRSLWIDEAYIAVEITARTWSEIIRQVPLFVDQVKPPIAFSLIVKSLAVMFGPQEYVLRLYPLLAGIGSVVLFYYFLKRYASREAAPLALGLFAVCDALVYYSAEVKPYGNDLFVMLVLYGLAEFILRNNDRWWRFLLLAVGGSVAVWLSFSSVFVLGGLGLVLGVRALLAGNGKAAGIILGVGLCWLANFVVLYLGTLDRMLDSEYFWSFHIWKVNVLSVPLFSWQALVWLKRIFLSAFQSPVGVIFPSFAAVLFLFGGYVVFRRDRARFSVLFAPVLLAILAAILRQYPFASRLILFVIPAFLVFMAEGAVGLVRLSRKAAIPAAVVLIGILFYMPVKTNAHYFVAGHSKEEMRPIMQFMKENFQPGDGIVVTDFALPQYFYYVSSLPCDYRTPSKILGLDGGQILEGYRLGEITDSVRTREGVHYVPFREIYGIYSKDGFLRRFLVNSKGYKTLFSHIDFQLVEGGRLWVILPNYQPDMKDFMLGTLGRNGRKLLEFASKRFTIYLFDMGPRSKSH